MSRGEMAEDRASDRCILAELDASIEELRRFMLEGEATAQADVATGGASDRVGRPAGRLPVRST